MAMDAKGLMRENALVRMAGVATGGEQLLRKSKYYGSTLLKNEWASGPKGHEALAATKVAATVATKAASYMNELAHHAQHNAEELDRARRAVERYILGSDMDTITDADPFINGSNIGGDFSPQKYSTFPVPMSTKSKGNSDGSFVPPYTELDIAKMPGMQPTKIAQGNMHKSGGKVPLMTPPDMDGRLLQEFDNSMRAGGSGMGSQPTMFTSDKDKMLQQFL